MVQSPCPCGLFLTVALLVGIKVFFGDE